MKRKLNRLRLWLIAELTKESEQYLLIEAVKQRIKQIESAKAFELGFDPDNAKDDIKELRAYIKRFNKADNI